MGQQSSGFCAQSNGGGLNMDSSPIDGVAVETLDRNYCPQVIFVDRKSLLGFFEKNNITAPKLESGSTFEFPSFFCETTLDLNEQMPSKENIKKFLALLCLARKIGFHVPTRDNTTSDTEKKICSFCDGEIAPHQKSINTAIGPIHDVCQPIVRVSRKVDDNIASQVEQLLLCPLKEGAYYFRIMSGLLFTFFANIPSPHHHSTSSRQISHWGKGVKQNA